MSESCVFCGIADGTISADIVYETAEVLAFWDISPVAPVHILVIPRRHIVAPSALDDDNASLMGELFLAVKAVAEQLGIADSGFRLVMNEGRYGGQSVFHMHMHLLGGRQMKWPPG